MVAPMNNSDQPKVFVVTPIFNGLDDTIEFLGSLSKATYRNYEVVIVDDGSTDSSTEVISEQFPGVLLLEGDGNLWWAGGTNLGVREALKRGAEYILTINNDNEVSPDFLESLVATALQNEGCIIKSVAYDYEDRNKVRSFGGDIRWWSGQIDEILLNINLDQKTVEVPLGNGNSTLIPAKVFREIGFYDEINCPQYHADSEFLLRARKYGYRVLVDNGSIIFNKVDNCVGRVSIEKMGFLRLLKDRRSAYYIKANYKIYREYCPYRFFQFFLLVRYALLFKEHVKRKITGYFYARSL